MSIINKCLCLGTFLTVLTSCGNSYKIQGNSSIASLDGKMAVIKVVRNNELINVDSAEIVHGCFLMNGTTDSTVMATLYIDNEGILPLVLEDGLMKIHIDMGGQSVQGTPLNEKLYKFIEKKNQLYTRFEELSHKQSRMIMEGVDPMEIERKLTAEAKDLKSETERIETDFITSNFENVLGLGVFMMLSSSNQYPLMTPQIEKIINKAPAEFKENLYVKDYISIAQENQRRIQSMQSGSSSADDSFTPSLGSDDTQMGYSSQIASSTRSYITE